MKNKIVGAAYDFKATLDLANSFISSGLTVQMFNGNQLNQESDAQVAVYNLESFFFTPEKEYDFAKKLFDNAKGAVCFLKSDSCMRGNIGAELAALKDGTETDALVFVPALPKASKYTENGIQYQVVDGKKNTLADGVKLISSFGVNVSCGDIDKQDKNSVLIVDCNSCDDFEKICRSLSELKPAALAGTGALASRMAEIYNLDVSKEESGPEVALDIDGKPGVLTRATLDWKEN